MNDQTSEAMLRLLTSIDQRLARLEAMAAALPQDIGQIAGEVTQRHGTLLERYAALGTP